MNVQLPGHLESLLSSLRSGAPNRGQPVESPSSVGQPERSAKPDKPGPAPGGGEHPLPKPEPEPEPGGFRGRFKIASLMPFLQGKPMFRGPLAGELSELADRARSALDELPADQSGKQTLRALRDHLNEALQSLYAEHEPGEPIDRQAAIGTLTKAFESFLAGLSGGNGSEGSGEEEAKEVGRSGPRLAPTPSRQAPDQPAETEETSEQTTGEAVGSEAATSSPPETSPPDDATFVSGEEVQSALGEWLTQLGERLGDRATARDQAWSQWLGQVTGFYVRGETDLLSGLMGQSGLDDRA